MKSRGIVGSTSKNSGVARNEARLRPGCREQLSDRLFAAAAVRHGWGGSIRSSRASPDTTEAPNMSSVSASGSHLSRPVALGLMQAIFPREASRLRARGADRPRDEQQCDRFLLADMNAITTRGLFLRVG